MKKTFKQFVKDYDIDLAKCQLCSSETLFYEGSNVHITYISLNKSIDGQDWLVLSKKLATKFYKNNDVKVLKEADAVFDKEHGWGLICHSSIKKHNVDLSNIFTNSDKNEEVSFMENENVDQNEADLNKLKESLYRLKARIDDNTGYVPLRYKYDCVIIDTDNFIADIDYIDEDEYGCHGTSHLSGKSFNSSILDSIDSFIEKYKTIMMYREQAESLFLEIAGCAEKAISRYNKPDIIVDFPAKVVTIDDNYDSDTEEERLFRIYSGEYGDFSCKEDDDGGLSYYEGVDYTRIRKISGRIIEEYYNVDLFEVEE